MKIVNIYKDIPTKLLTLTKPRNSPIQSQKAPKDFQIGQYQKYKIDQWLKKDYLNILYMETPKHFSDPNPTP